MRLARSPDEWHERRSRRNTDSGIGTPGRPPMVPRDEPSACLRHKAVALTRRASRRVIHRVTALPLLFYRAHENAHGRVGSPQKMRQQPVLEPCACRTIRHLCRIVRRPPDFVGTGRRRTVWRRAARHGRRQAMRVIGSVRTEPLRTIHITVIAAIHRVRETHLLQITETSRLLRPRSGSGECRQQHARENCNDRNDHEQFNDRKPAPSRRTDLPTGCHGRT